ncbi:NS2 [plateatu pika coronavirus P83]|nr:NS2 [plateatu pika coronavirus P83]
MAFADKPNYFVNFPLKHFVDFYESFVCLQRELVFKFNCKIQNTPHVSITMLDVRNSELLSADRAICDCIDYMFIKDLQVRFTNLHFLGSYLVCDVVGLQSLHDDVEQHLREAFVVCGQSRAWYPHLTVARFDCVPSVMAEIVEVFQSCNFSFDFILDLVEGAPFYLEIVKIGAHKSNGFYNPTFSRWVYGRLSVPPPTEKLDFIMDVGCIMEVRFELYDDDLPSDPIEAWHKVKHAYDNNLWFYRHCLSKSKLFRRHVQARRCVCGDEFSSDDADSS